MREGLQATAIVAQTVELAVCMAHHMAFHMMCHMTNQCLQVYGKKSPLWLNIINGTLCVLLFFVTCVASISSVRYIVVDSVNYHVFANL